MAPGADSQPRSVFVSKHAPVTRAQFEAWGRWWPLSFHEAAARRALTPWANSPSTAEIETMRGHMRRAIQLAQQSQSGEGGRAAGAF